MDHVQSFTKSPIDKYIYLNLPSVFRVEDGDKDDYALKLHRNIYGQKQYVRVWYKYLTKKLIKDLVFNKSDINECFFYRVSVM